MHKLTVRVLFHSGLVWVWFFLPETSGKSLEGMDEMFNLPWHVIGRKGHQLTAGHGSVAEAYGKDAKTDVEMIEDTRTGY